MKRMFLYIMSIITIGIAVPAILVASPVYAAPKDEICDGVEVTGATCGGGSAKIDDVVAVIINVLSWLAGVTAVVFVIWGGFKYITSGGDSNKVSSAKSTIIYALIGIVIVALSQVIVRYVLDIV